MSSSAMKQPAPTIQPPAAGSAVGSPKKMAAKFSLFSHVKYEHMVAGISGKNY